ncbi:hypothetical protein HZB60_07835 [candidate division KSB1 bacterium]|nr:hypothetical protein [candidate division KSB1 bacterium]
MNRVLTRWVALLVGAVLLFGAALAIARSVVPRDNRHRALDDADPESTRDLIMHDIGNVRMTLSNYGEAGNPDVTPGFRGFEFPLNSGSDFLFSAGVWVGAVVDGQQRVTTATDGDNGTGEFWPVHLGTVPFNRTVGAVTDFDWHILSKNFSTFGDQSYQYGAKDIDDDGDWAGNPANDYDGDGRPSKNYDKGAGLIGYDDDGDGLIDEDSVAHEGNTWEDVDVDNDDNTSDTGPSGDINHDGNCKYDPEPFIDEDPAGNMALDYIDNDSDGLVDYADSDFDGDANVASDDDDGDGEFDEDGVARGVQEYYCVFQDSISQTYVSSPSGEHIPLQIQMLQRTYAFPEAYAAGFILLDYRIRNIGQRPLRNCYIAMFSDPDILAPGESGDAGSTDDGNFYDPERLMMIQYDDTADADGNGPGIFAIRVVKTPVALEQLRVTFANFERVAGGDPEFDADKYAMMSSGDQFPPTEQLGDWRMMISFGDALSDGFEIPPGEELPITVAFIAGGSIAEGQRNAEWALAMYLNDFQGPSAPDVPDFNLDVYNDFVRIRWAANSEASVDAITGLSDFEGYTIERSTDQEHWQTIAGYDRIDTLEFPFEWQNFNLGMPGLCGDQFPGEYCYEDRDLIPGQTYYYVVRAFDQGVQGAGILYSGVSGNAKTAALFLTDTAPANLDHVFVYPNPYKGSHAGEAGGRINPQTGLIYYPRLLYFKGLPATTAAGDCRIRIFSLGGDHLATIEHTNGTDGDVWDLNTGSRQEIVSGLYYYTVEYKKPGGGTEQKIDKFVVLK